MWGANDRLTVYAIQRQPLVPCSATVVLILVYTLTLHPYHVRKKSGVWRGNDRYTVDDIQRHPWYMKDLPPGVKEMNDNLPLPAPGLQVTLSAHPEVRTSHPGVSGA